MPCFEAVVKTDEKAIQPILNTTAVTTPQCIGRREDHTRAISHHLAASWAFFVLEAIRNVASAWCLQLPESYPDPSFAS